MHTVAQSIKKILLEEKWPERLLLLHIPRRFGWCWSPIKTTYWAVPRYLCCELLNMNPQCPLNSIMYFKYHGFARNAKRDRNGIHIRIENNNNKIRHLMLEYKWWIVLSVTNKPFYGLLHPLEMNSSFLHRKWKENATYSPVQYKNSSTANPPLNLFVDSSRDEVHFQLLILLSFRLFNPQRPRSRISPPLKGGPPIVPSGCLKKMPFSIAHHHRANN